MLTTVTTWGPTTRPVWRRSNAPLPLLAITSAGLIRSFLSRMCDQLLLRVRSSGMCLCLVRWQMLLIASTFLEVAVPRARLRHWWQSEIGRNSLNKLVSMRPSWYSPRVALLTEHASSLWSREHSSRRRLWGLCSWSTSTILSPLLSISWSSCPWPFSSFHGLVSPVMFGCCQTSSPTSTCLKNTESKVKRGGKSLLGQSGISSAKKETSRNVISHSERSLRSRLTCRWDRGPKNQRILWLILKTSLNLTERILWPKIRARKWTLFRNNITRFLRIR